MRLTLRTLLAYLDDILEPDDAQEISKKLEESEFAANIVHRTRDVMRRLRLGAPGLIGRGMGVDPNTVAEYLDNTLSPDRIPEFEKACLETDMLLAETASCHQILTLLLGEPAEVDAESRRKMYGLIDRPERPAVSASAVAAAAAAVPSSAPPHPTGPAIAAGATAAAAAVAETRTNGQPATAAAPSSVPSPERHQPEVPDYLRDEGGRWPWGGLAAAALLLLLFGGLIALATNPQWFSLASNDTEVTDDDRIPPRPANGKEPSDDEVATAVPGAEDDETPATDEEPSSDSETPAEDPTGIVTAPADTETLAEDDAGPTPPRLVVTDDVAGADPRPVTTPAEDAAAPLPDETTDEEPATDVAATETPAEDAMPAEGATETPAPAEEPVAAEEPDENVPSSSIGQLLSQKNVLLIQNPDTSQWQRLPPREVLFPGDRLVSLPTYRSTISLSNGVTAEIIGDTALDLGAPDAQGVPTLDIAYGRAVALAGGRGQPQVWVRSGDLQGLVTFDSAGSTLGIEVSPLHTEGADPALEIRRTRIDLYAVSGNMTWESPDGQVLEMESPDHRILGDVESRRDRAEVQIPPWVSSDQLSDIDKKGSEAIEAYLAYNQESVFGLREQADHRRSEIAALAVRCLASIGEFEPLVAALRNENHRTAWSEHADTLRNATTRSPETAIQVRTAIQRERGEEAGQLYRMLWGYTEADLKAGAAKKLVDFLDHEDLDYRVLSFWNLRDITGLSLFYRPEYTGTKRQPYIQKWRQRLESNQIVPKTAEPAVGG